VTDWPEVILLVVFKLPAKDEEPVLRTSKLPPIDAYPTASKLVEREALVAESAPDNVSVVMLAVPNVVVPVTPRVPLIVALPPIEA
jgi:hypothetical protein